MYLYDDATAYDAPPAPPAAGRAPGYYGDGAPGVSPRTIVRAWHLNLMMEELLGPVVAAGLAPSRTDATQLLQAIRLIAQGGASNYAVDVSQQANAVVVALTPAPAALVSGLVVRAKIAHTNTDASTLTVSGLGAWPIYRSGQGLTPGDLLAGVVFEFIWQDDHWDLQSPAPLSAEAISYASYCVDTSPTPNLVVGAPVPTPVGLIDGLAVKVRMAHTNTGAATFTLAGQGNAPILANGIGLFPGMLKANQVYELVYCQGFWELATPPATLVQRGVWAGGDTAGPKAIVFDQPYAAGVVPHISLTTVVGSPAGVDTVQLDSMPTNTGFTVQRRNYVGGSSSATSAGFLWRAEGPA